MEKLTRRARRHSKDHLRNDRGQDMHATHDGRVILHSMKINRQVVVRVVRCEQYNHEEEHRSGRRPDDAHFQHLERDHGIVATAPFPTKEDDEGHGRTGEKADHDRAIPRVLVASPLQSQERDDCSQSDEDEAREIERMNSGAEGLAHGGFVLGLGDVYKQGKGGDHCS